MPAPTAKTTCASVDGSMETITGSVFLPEMNKRKGADNRFVGLISIELLDEIPICLGHPSIILAIGPLGPRRPNVRALENTCPCGIARIATLVIDTDGIHETGGFALGSKISWLAAISLREIIDLGFAEVGPCTGTVLCAVGNEDGNRPAVRLVTAAHISSGVHGDGPHLFRHSAGEGVGHGTAHAEARSEDA